MKRIAILVAITLVAFTYMVPLAYAGGMEKSSLKAQETSKFIGAPVKNLQGEELGSIKRLTLLLPSFLMAG